MKFGEFFKKYTLCALIYTAISAVVTLLTLAGIGIYNTKQLNKENDEIQSLYDELQSNDSDEE